jgi:hypothetical protein
LTIFAPYLFLPLIKRTLNIEHPPLRSKITHKPLRASAGAAVDAALFRDDRKAIEAFSLAEFVGAERDVAVASQGVDGGIE